jgi:uncharacterized protein YllA (UPF0747 family)
LNAECFPISVVPGLSRFFLDYCNGEAAVRSWFGGGARDRGWQRALTSAIRCSPRDACGIAGAQNSAAALLPVARFARERKVVVTGQQVGVLGGPLFTPHKAATAVALAREATAAGHAHVPIFWLASEDHDFPEVNHVTFPARRELSKLTYESAPKRRSGRRRGAG